VRVKQNGDFVAVTIEAVPFGVPSSPERFALVTFEAPVGPDRLWRQETVARTVRAAR